MVVPISCTSVAPATHRRQKWWRVRVFGPHLTCLGQWAAGLQKVAYVEFEGELRYREFTPAESDRSVRVAEIYGRSILLLDRPDQQPAPKLRAQSPSRNQPIKQISRASLRIDARLFSRKFLFGLDISQECCFGSSRPIQFTCNAANCQRAIACNGLRHRWQLWRPEQRGICNLQICRGHHGFESHPHRSIKSIT